MGNAAANGFVGDPPGAAQPFRRPSQESTPEAMSDSNRVRCGSCQTVLRVPPNAPRFRCPCGAVLSAPVVNTSSSSASQSRSTTSSATTASNSPYPSLQSLSSTHASAPTAPSPMTPPTAPSSSTTRQLALNNNAAVVSSTGTVTCATCRTVIRPPAGAPRFRCPCGSVVTLATSPTSAPSSTSSTSSVTSSRQAPNNNAAVQNERGLVVCSACFAQLRRPPNAPRFRCQCGAVITMAPGATSGGNSGGGGAASSNGSSAVVSTPTQRRAVASARPAQNQRPTVTRGTSTTMPGTIRCTRCRVLLRPPAGASRFRCPCGQVLSTSETPPSVENPVPAAAPSEVEPVRCTRCRILLRPPQGESRFRCPCGQVLTVQVKVPLVASMPIAKLLQAKRPNQQWIKQAGSDKKLHWFRVLDQDEVQQLMALEEEIMENLSDRIKERPDDELRNAVAAMGMDPNNFFTRKELEELMLSAPEIIFTMFSESEIKKILEKLGADYSSCKTKNDLAMRLFVAAWEGGQGKFKADSWVRNFNEVTGDLEWISATDYSFGVGNVDESILTPDELERMATKSFDDKLAWFKEKCRGLQVPWEQGRVMVKVNRSNVLVDSFQSLSKLKVNDFHRFFRFEFIGEPGVDAGGVAREWFQLVTDACFNVDLGLFEYSGVDNICYQINPSSGFANEDHLAYFHFLGRILAKALFDGHVIAAHLARPLYKHLLAWPIGPKDIEFVDPQIAKSLDDVMTAEDVSMFYLDFTTAVRVFGETQTVELKEGGADIDVTNDNRGEYVELITKRMMLGQIQPQLRRFLEGFYEVIPQPLLSVFDFQELELFMHGLPTIDIDDWRKNTRYRGEFKRVREGHKVVQWFWQVVEASSQEQRARFLQFATGTSRVPVQGFAALQGNDGNIKTFCIESVPFEQSVFPKAHTCFNRIELPLYPSKALMEKYLSQAIQMEMTGFTIE